MTGTPRPYKSRVLAKAVLLLALSGCGSEDGFGLDRLIAPRDGQAPDSAAQTGVAARDTEVPEVFQVTEPGLWDGRPSLGGIWVAHPQVDAPERVIIRNRDNGRSVTGALFRRERDTPGPQLQVSSEAAAALEMLAGNPAELQVTALRREEVSTPDPAATDDFDSPDEISAAPLDDGPADGATDTGTSAKDAADQASETAGAAAPPPAPARGRRPNTPYIRAATFSVEANATRAADRLRGDGVVPTVVAQDGDGRTFWRVLASPANPSEDPATLLEKVRDMGFSDAYVVSD